jgi:hypothetical protein
MSDGFILYQEKYIHDLPNRDSLTNHRTAETLMVFNVHLTTTNDEPLKDPTRYCHILVSLAYLGVTRQDISYFVYIMSQIISALTQIYYSHLLHVMCYLRATISHRLFFSRSSSLSL